jgi:hypothetical protein
MKPETLARAAARAVAQGKKMNDENGRLLWAYAQAVERMRKAQKEFERTGTARWAAAMRSAEREVDELTTLHLLPELPPLVPDVKGGVP